MFVTARTIRFDTWTWGAGQRSMRMHTQVSDGGGNPWRELLVVYWHPGREQVRLLGLHPDIPGIGRGVTEGTRRIEGETAEAHFDLFQPGVRRDMAVRWTFDGSDTYHEALLEAHAGAGFVQLAEWDPAPALSASPPGF